MELKLASKYLDRLDSVISGLPVYDTIRTRLILHQSVILCPPKITLDLLWDHHSRYEGFKFPSDPQALNIGHGSSHVLPNIDIRMFRSANHFRQFGGGLGFNDICKLVLIVVSGMKR